MERVPGAVLLILVLLATAPPFFGPAEAATAAGAPAPDFELKDLEGKSHRLSSLRGEVVVLHFWATWCPHCLAEMPLLAALAHDESFPGVRILAINLGEPGRVVERYLKSRSLDLPVLLDSRGKVAASYGVAGLPATVVLDSAGRRVQEISMGSLTREELEKVLSPLMEKRTGQEAKGN